MSRYMKGLISAVERKQPRCVVRAFVLGLLVCSFAVQVSAQMTGPKPDKIPDIGMGHQVFYHVLLDQFEGRTSDPEHEFRWDGEAWVGTDMNKLWLKSEGFSTNNTVSDTDHEALYDRPLPHTRYFDGQAGIRADLDSGPKRAWAAIGVEGLLPYYFQFAPTLYFRDGGNVAARVTGSYDLLLTQRWILQPQAELNFYNKDDVPRRVGSGLSDLDTGLRLRYEFSRKFAPYIGFAYTGRYGSTASYSRQVGETTSDPRFIFGLRLWY